MDNTTIYTPFVPFSSDLGLSLENSELGLEEEFKLSGVASSGLNEKTTNYNFSSPNFYPSSMMPTEMNLGTPKELGFLESNFYQARVLDKAYGAGLLAMVFYREFSPVRSELSKATPLWENVMALNPAFANPLDESLGYSREKIFHLLQAMNIKPVSNTDLNLCVQNAQGVEYSMKGLSRPDIHFSMDKEGCYLAQDGLASAWITKQPDADHPGKFKLNVAFRGTEFSDLPSYLLHAYFNMSWHYAQFRPLTRAVVAFAENPDNNISGISATGHSLGGAMVQEFLRDYPEGSTQVPIEGHTFGSPGSVKKGFYKFFALGVQLAEKVLGVLLSPITMNLSEASLGVAIATQSDKLYKFHTLCNFVSQKLYDKPVYKDAPDFDGRLKEFYHFDDAVPKMGQKGYRSFGSRFKIFNENYETPKNEQSLLSSFSEGVRKHAMMGYCRIFDSALKSREEILKGGPVLSEEVANLSTLSALNSTIVKMTASSIEKLRLQEARQNGDGDLKSNPVLSKGGVNLSTLPTLSALSPNTDQMTAAKLRLQNARGIFAKKEANKKFNF